MNQGSRQTINILYFDDNGEDREIFADYIERLGRQGRPEDRHLPMNFYVECVATIESALFSLGIRTFDILFVDYLLVDRSGRQSTSEKLLQSLLAQGVRIPVVISSDYPQSSLPSKYLNLLPERQVHFLPKSEWSAQSLGELVQRILSTPLKLLYLESSGAELERVRGLLSRIGRYHFEVEVAPDAVEVREALRSGQYDVLLADIDVDGDSAAIAAEAARNDWGPPVVVLTDEERDSPALHDLDLQAGHGIHLLRKNSIDESTLLASILASRNRSRERIRLEETIER